MPHTSSVEREASAQNGCRTGKLPSLILLALFPLADPAGGSSAGIGDEESASRIGEEDVAVRGQVKSSALDASGAG